MRKTLQPLTLESLENVLDKKLNSFRKEIDGEFAQIDTRFTQIDKRFEQMDERFERLENQASNNFSVLLEIIQNLRKDMNEKFEKNDRNHEEMMEALKNFTARVYDQQEKRFTKLEHKVFAN